MCVSAFKAGIRESTLLRLKTTHVSFTDINKSNIITQHDNPQPTRKVTAMMTTTTTTTKDKKEHKLLFLNVNNEKRHTHHTIHLLSCVLCLFPFFLDVLSTSVLLKASLSKTSNSKKLVLQQGTIESRVRNISLVSASFQFSLMINQTKWKVFLFPTPWLSFSDKPFCLNYSLAIVCLSSSSCMCSSRTSLKQYSVIYNKSTQTQQFMTNTGAHFPKPKREVYTQRRARAMKFSYLIQYL